MPSRHILARPLRRLLFFSAVIAASAGSASSATGPSFVRIIDTGSMHPIVSHELFLPLDPIPYGNLAVGMVAVYRHDRTGLVVAHRIVGRQFSWYVMKGDSNPRPDSGFMTQDNYLGVVHLPQDPRAPVLLASNSRP
jgi:signal peptidase I